MVRRSWRKLLRQPAASALGVALLTLGCSNQSETDLHVYSWWQANSERYAFDRVSQIYHRLHPHLQARNEATQDDQQRQNVAEHLLAGAPPDTFQANLGADLLHWSVVDTAAPNPSSNALLEDISDVLARNGLLDQLPDELLSELRVGTKYFGVPINIHRLNVLYYNPSRLDAYKKATGKSFLDLGVLCPDAAPESGDPHLKIAMDTSHGWVLVLLALENLLPALNGATFYDHFFHGEPAGDLNYRAGLERALTCFRHLSKSFVPVDSWTKALDKLTNPDDPDQVAFTISGDWANGQLDNGELAAGQVVAVPFPGTADIFVYTADTFPLPLHNTFHDETKALLDTLASPEAQLAFSEEKGSVPARRDVALGPRALARRQSASDFPDAASKLLATSGLFPPYYPTGDLGDRLHDIYQPTNADSDPIQRAIDDLMDWSSLLTDWQQRLAAGPADPKP